MFIISKIVVVHLLNQRVCWPSGTSTQQGCLCVAWSKRTKSVYKSNIGKLVMYVR